MIDIKSEIEKCVKLYARHTNRNVDDIVKKIDNDDISFKGTLGEYEKSETLRKCIEMYKEGELDASYYYIIQGLLSLTEDIRFNNNDFENFERGVNFLVDLKEIYRPFNIYLKGTYYPRIYKEMAGVCKCKDDNEIFTPIDIYKIKKSINSRHLKMYCYKESENKNFPDKFAVKNAVVATDNIDSIFNAKSEFDDAWSVQIGLFIERNINLSYFVITFAYGNGVYVLSDKPNYKNPDQLDRVSSRNGGLRFSEDREASNYLPYILIDKVLDRRKENTEVSKKDAKYNELYVFPTEDYFSFNLYYLIKYSIEHIIADDFAYIVKRDVLLLTANSSIDLTDINHYDCKNDYIEKIYKDVYEDIKTTLPAVTTTALMPEIEKFPIILTPEQFEKDVKYLAHKKLADDIINIKYNGLDVNDPQGRYEIRHMVYKQKDEIDNIVKKNIKKLLPYIFAGNKVYINDLDNPRDKIPHFGTGNSLSCLFAHEHDKNEKFSTYEKSILSNEQATTCIYIYFHHYKELMTLMNLKREDIPSTFRYYMSNDYMPYIGNSILNNINPLYEMMERDFASRDYVNGLTVYIPFRKTETNKLYKTHKIGDEVIINIHGKTCRIDSVVLVDNFLNKAHGS